MEVGFDQTGHDAVARAQDVLPDDALEGELLPPLLALDEKSELLRKGPERLDDVSGRVAARTAGTARHALAAIPDGLAAQQLLDRLVVARLDDIDDLARIVTVELRRRTDARTDPAVHAGVQPFAHPHVFEQHIVIFTHRKLCSPGQQSYAKQAEMRVV